MRVLLVLLCLATPAEAATWRLSGATITDCHSLVTLPDGITPDPAPCTGQVGRSFDGKVRIVRSLVDGQLRNRWLYLPPEPGLFPEAETLAPEALRVKLGFPWDGVLSAGIHLNRRGNIDKWWFTTSNDGNNLWHEAAWQSIHTSTLEFYATGTPGSWAKVPWRPKAKALAAPVAPSPVPLPPSLALIAAGAVSFVALRAVRRGR